MEKVHELIRICKKSQDDLKSWLREEMLNYYSRKRIKMRDDYLYVKGILPVCLVAHLDTVHKQEPVKFYYDPILKNLFSPTGIGGDDRCGVYIILELLKRGFRPSIIFCCDEEIGGVGAREFTKIYEEIKNVNWFLEFDRKGSNDVVCYGDDNKELTQVFEQFGFKKAYGSFSDISILAPHYKKSAVNVSSGYYSPHTINEYISMDDLDWIVETASQILSSKYVNNTYEYKVREYKTYSGYGTTTLIQGSSKYHCSCCERFSYYLHKSEFGEVCDACVNEYKMQYCFNCKMYVWEEKGVCEVCKNKLGLTS